MAHYGVVSEVQDPDVAFTDLDIRHILENLFRSGHISWSKIPRIHTVLNSIGHLEAISAFLDEGITDIGFPFAARTLPLKFSNQAAGNDFLKVQKRVLSKVLDLENGSSHHYFSEESDLPLLSLSELGKGAFGRVDRVRSEISFREYARKRIPRGPNFRKDKEILKEFENELHNLKKVSHRHIVELVSSYTEPRFVGILMSPVADCNLKQYLEGPFESSLVRNLFGCLATAICFLHEKSIRHKDIKPENVLVYRGSVLLTDFGLSREWTDAALGTTEGLTLKTPRYCAPEVADYGPRNTSSDIWSLGCVSLEMWAVISGHSVNSLIRYLSENGTSSTCYYRNLPAVYQWRNLIASFNSIPSVVFFWIERTLQMDRYARWTARELFENIQEFSESSSIGYVGPCCDHIPGTPESVGPCTPEGEIAELDLEARREDQPGLESIRQQRRAENEEARREIEDLKLQVILAKAKFDQVQQGHKSELQSELMRFEARFDAQDITAQKLNEEAQRLVYENRRMNDRHTEEQRNLQNAFAKEFEICFSKLKRDKEDEHTTHLTEMLILRDQHAHIETELKKYIGEQRDDLITMEQKHDAEREQLRKDLEEKWADSKRKLEAQHADQMSQMRNEASQLKEEMKTENQTLQKDHEAEMRKQGVTLTDPLTELQSDNLLMKTHMNELQKKRDQMTINHMAELGHGDMAELRRADMYELGRRDREVHDTPKKYVIDMAMTPSRYNGKMSRVEELGKEKSMSDLGNPPQQQSRGKHYGLIGTAYDHPTGRLSSPREFPSITEPANDAPKIPTRSDSLQQHRTKLAGSGEQQNASPTKPTASPVKKAKPAKGSTTLGEQQFRDRGSFFNKLMDKLDVGPKPGRLNIEELKKKRKQSLK